MSETQIELFRAIIAVVISGAILNFYYRRKIAAIDALVYGLATQAYVIYLIGPTITPLFIVGYAFFVEEMIKFLTSRLSVKKRIFKIIILPAFSSAVVFAIFIFDPNILRVLGDSFSFYLRPFYFYFKQFLPYFAMGYKVYKERNRYGLNYFFGTLKTVATFSCYIAMFQLLVYAGLRNALFSEILGNRRGYMMSIGGIAFIRLQAFFIEPKGLAAFLGVAIPLFVKDKMFKKAALASFVGVLTYAATFPVILFSAFVSLVAFGKIQTLRTNLFGSMAIILLMFISLSAAKDYLLNLYVENSNSVVADLLLKRTIDLRYSSGNVMKGDMLLGIPLQSDLEGPVYRYFLDHPLLLLSGYGPANDSFLPAHYWYGQWDYWLRLEGKPSSMDMRWFYYLSQFGAPIFLVILWALTDVKDEPFTTKYFSFLLLGWFFANIDILVVIMYSLLYQSRRRFS